MQRPANISGIDPVGVTARDFCYWPSAFCRTRFRQFTTTCDAVIGQCWFIPNLSQSQVRLGLWRSGIDGHVTIIASIASLPKFFTHDLFIVRLLVF